MTKLTKKELLHIAKLSNLRLSNAEIEKFTPQLSKVVDFISELAEVDTEGVEPTGQTTGLFNIYRPDVVNQKSVLGQEEALSGTRKKHKGYFLVPAILSKRTEK